ncbi:hypothetical protein HYDPIDRAFT_85606 [Hydnomerulius pinastri MD-312]|nr:hypothetical protein HYDPIDRAFT_85606 [Hydnomerulius pinastri MD-312]
MESQVDTINPILDAAKAGDVRLLKPSSRSSAELYKLSPEDAAFFKAQTGIDNDEALKEHILAVQERAYKVVPYPCIRSFTFLHLDMTKLPVYESIINLGRERSNAVLLDIGCCFGVDARKAAADGFPLKNIVASDLKKEFLDLGHDLFKTSPASYPGNFVSGDAFDPDTLDIVPPFNEPPSTQIPDLTTLTSLNPLAGHCSVIHASKFFHLFTEDNQLRLARALAGLLSPEPGSILCGGHVANWEKGVIEVEIGGEVYVMFCHSPESWVAIWDGGVFDKGKVKVDTAMKEYETDEGVYWYLQWAMTRL